MTRLAPGESVVTTVQAKEPWNATGIALEAGRTYRFDVPGEQVWIDWFVRTSADGFSRLIMKPFERGRRLPKVKWLALCGTVGQNTGTAFVIGRRLDAYRPPGDGELFCFGNDWKSAYRNNRGSLQLTVTCTA